jgi:phosphoribosylglycinamide formyltransferase-1
VARGPTPDTGPAPVRIGVLASGSGTILEAILLADLPVRLVAVDRPCRALDVATAAAVPSVLVDRADYGGFGPGFDREAFTRAVADVLVTGDVDVVVMAGFGTVLAQPVHDAFPGRILNTHPALLPAFPGWHAVRDALAAGVAETGTTVHVAHLEMDTGPVLAQASVAVLPGDTESSLHERIKAVERTLYPATIRSFIDDLDSEAVGGGRAPDHHAPDHHAPDHHAPDHHAPEETTE